MKRSYSTLDQLLGCASVNAGADLTPREVRSTEGCRVWQVFPNLDVRDDSRVSIRPSKDG
jgi:hypothetical protein